MINRNKFIVMEGIMGSGKTTLANMLAEKLNGVYFNTPKSFRDLRHVADRSLSVQARYHFYLSLNSQTSSEISELLKEKPVICDKYVWSTVCYHKTLGLNISCFPKINIIMPDFCFLIFCEDRIRLERIFKRDPVKDYSKDFLRQEMERRCLEEFKKILSGTMIDNSLDNPENAFSKIITLIN